MTETTADHYVLDISNIFFLVFRKTPKLIFFFVNTWLYLKTSNLSNVFQSHFQLFVFYLTENE